MESLGDRLKIVRNHLKLNKQEFANAVEVSSPNTIYKWEHDLSSPPAKVLGKLHEKYRIDVQWLVTGKGSMLADGKKEADILYIDLAVKLVDEAIRETGTTINNKQKDALVEIVREEMRKGAKAKIVGILKALKGGG